MSKLFAALGQTGEIQFVGDVARGAACGCFCPVCLSPLVPDQHGLVLQATQELEELAQQEKDRLHRAAAQRLQQAGKRWAQIRNRMDVRGVGAGDGTIAEESIASPQTATRARRHPAGHRALTWRIDTDGNTLRGATGRRYY